LAFLCSASLATAATLNESDVGGFSNSINGANGFTQIAGGFDQIDGTLIRRAYSLGVPGNVGGPSQVPLPAAGWLLLAALGGAAWASRRKNRANAAALAPA